jgi:hypothetical protein
MSITKRVHLTANINKKMVKVGYMNSLHVSQMTLKKEGM